MEPSSNLRYLHGIYLAVGPAYFSWALWNYRLCFVLCKPTLNVERLATLCGRHEQKPFGGYQTRVTLLSAASAEERYRDACVRVSGAVREPQIGYTRFLSVCFPLSYQLASMPDERQPRLWSSLVETYVVYLILIPLYYRTLPHHKTTRRHKR